MTSPETVDVFSLTISRDLGGDFAVRSVDVLGRSMRHRISFTQANGINEVFETELAECILSIIDRLPMDAHVFSDPDFVIELPGLTLARLRALINIAADGAMQIILRFRYFIGTLQSAFRIDTHLRIPTLEHREQIAIEALADIATPIFSLALSGANGPDTPAEVESVRRKLDHLANRASEVNFYLSLLTRYATECARQRNEQDPRWPWLEPSTGTEHIPRIEGNRRGG